jgi:hypothetical protein
LLIGTVLLQWKPELLAKIDGVSSNHNGDTLFTCDAGEIIIKQKPIEGIDPRFIENILI